jgi:hypothetical protein
MRGIALSGAVILVVTVLAGCGDDKSREERNREAQRAIQEGAQKERQLYEGMQKQLEKPEKKPADQKATN